MKYLAAPPNSYFHVFCDNPFHQSFEFIQRKGLTFNVAHMKIHKSITGSLTPQHVPMLQNFKLFQFLFWKDTLKYSRIYKKDQVLETDVSQFIVFLSFVCSYYADILFVRSYKICKIQLPFYTIQYYISVTLLKISKNIRTTTLLLRTLLHYQSHQLSGC